MLFEHGAPSPGREPEESEASLAHGAPSPRSEPEEPKEPASASAADQPASSPEAQAQCRLKPPHAASTSSASPTT